MSVNCEPDSFCRISSTVPASLLRVSLHHLFLLCSTQQQIMFNYQELQMCESKRENITLLAFLHTFLCLLGGRRLEPVYQTFEFILPVCLPNAVLRTVRATNYPLLLLQKLFHNICAVLDVVSHCISKVSHCFQGKRINKVVLKLARNGRDFLYFFFFTILFSSLFLCSFSVRNSVNQMKQIYITPHSAHSVGGWVKLITIALRTNSYIWQKHLSSFFSICDLGNYRNPRLTNAISYQHPRHTASLWISLV